MLKKKGKTEVVQLERNGVALECEEETATMVLLQVNSEKAVWLKAKSERVGKRREILETSCPELKGTRAPISKMDAYPLKIFQVPASPLHACFETKSALYETTCPAGQQAELLFVGLASYLFGIFVPRWLIGLDLSFVVSSCCVGQGIRLGI
jgi:hypothetical protein